LEDDNVKRLALLLALLASPAAANDNVTIIYWGTTPEAGPCQFASMAAAISNGACVRTITDPTNTALGQMVVAYQPLCNTALETTCSVPQVVSYVSTWLNAQAYQYMQSYYLGVATQGAIVPAPLH
jgi:hypothetical protein